MTGRHSPPPWDLDEETGAIEAASGGAICHMAHHGNINTVARTGEYFSHADARLIRASPELLDFVRRVLPRLRGRGAAATDPAAVGELGELELEADLLIASAEGTVKWPTP